MNLSIAIYLYYSQLREYRLYTFTINELKRFLELNDIKRSDTAIYYHLKKHTEAKILIFSKIPYTNKNIYKLIK